MNANISFFYSIVVATAHVDEVTFKSSPIRWSSLQASPFVASLNKKFSSVSASNDFFRCPTPALIVPLVFERPKAASLLGSAFELVG